MGRCRADAFTGIIALSWALENGQGTVSARDDGCLQRSEGGEDCLHDEFSNRENRTAEQYMRIFPPSRSRTDFGAAANARNGQGLVDLTFGTNDLQHASIKGTDRDPKSKDGDNTILLKTFRNGARLAIAGKQFAS